LGNKNHKPIARNSGQNRSKTNYIFLAQTLNCVRELFAKIVGQIMVEWTGIWRVFTYNHNLNTNSGSIKEKLVQI